MAGMRQNIGREKKKKIHFFSDLFLFRRRMVTFVILAFHFPITGKGITSRFQFLPIPRLLLQRSPSREIDSSCTPQLSNRNRNLELRIMYAPRSH